MQVDETRQHQPPTRIEHARRARPRYIRLERLDAPEANADVAPAAQVLTRIEHLAALDHQIELVVRPHRRAHGEAQGSRRERRAHAGDEAPARLLSHTLLPGWNNATRESTRAAPASSRAAAKKWGQINFTKMKR